MCQESEMFLLLQQYQPFNQTILYLWDTHNTQSNNIIPMGHPQHTIKQYYTYGTPTTHNQTILYLWDTHNTQSNHIFTRPLYLVIFHTAHRVTGSSSLILYSAIQNFSWALTEAGIIKHNTPQHTCRRTHCHKQMHINTHTHAHKHTGTNTHIQTHTLREGKDRL